MSTFEFSPAMRLALDTYRVPPLPDDFAERVVAKALAESRRRPAAPLRSSRWRRTGRIVTGTVVAGLLSATAAAAGWFGQPVYVPVISELIERIAPAKPKAPAAASIRPAPIASPRAELAPVIEPVQPPAAAPAPAPAITPPAPPQPRAPEAPAPTPAAVTTRQAPAPASAPDPVERAELRRESAPLAPQRPTAIVDEPSPRTIRAAIDPVVPTEPVSRATPTPTRTAAPVPREIRPAERLRVPTETRPPRTAPTTTERRQQVRERRIP